jgi:hypothetical protein
MMLIQTLCSLSLTIRYEIGYFSWYFESQEKFLNMLDPPFEVSLEFLEATKNCATRCPFLLRYTTSYTMGLDEEESILSITATPISQQQYSKIVMGYFFKS